MRSFYFANSISVRELSPLTLLLRLTSHHRTHASPAQQLFADNDLFLGDSPITPHKIRVAIDG